MYSRYHDRADRPMQIPENYSGCAFPKNEAAERAPIPPPPPILHEPPPMKKPPADPIPSPPPLCEEEKEVEKQPTVAAPPCTPTPPSPPLPFAKGLLARLNDGSTELDTLLILGLIFLLLHDGEDTEIVLWLLLLLFC